MAGFPPEKNISDRSAEETSAAGDGPELLPDLRHEALEFHHHARIGYHRIEPQALVKQKGLSKHSRAWHPWGKLEQPLAERQPRGPLAEDLPRRFFKGGEGRFRHDDRPPRLLFLLLNLL